MKLLEAREYSPVPPCTLLWPIELREIRQTILGQCSWLNTTLDIFIAQLFPFDLYTHPHIHTPYGHTHMHTHTCTPTHAHPHMHTPLLLLFLPSPSPPPPPTVKHLPCRTRRESARVTCVPSNPSRTRKQIKQTHKSLCVCIHLRIMLYVFLVFVFVFCGGLHEVTLENSDY